MRKIIIPIILLPFIVLSSAVLSDVITLKNGEVLEGKVVKEMKDLVKVRVPCRGKIITTFYKRGNIESIKKTTEEITRTAFKKEGVRNPRRDFKPVYYGGVRTVTASAGAGTRVGAKAPRPKASKKRGIEARRDRFKTGLNRFAKTETSTTASTASSSRPAATTSSSSPSTTGTATTTESGFGK